MNKTTAPAVAPSPVVSEAVYLEYVMINYSDKIYQQVVEELSKLGQPLTHGMAMLILLTVLSRNSENRTYCGPFTSKGNIENVI